MSQVGKLNYSFAYSPAYALTSKPEDIIAAENAEELNSHWWMDMYAWGRYPEAAWNYLEANGLAPEVEEGDFELLREGTPDFMGLNYYQTTTFEKNPLEGGVGSAEMNTTGKRELRRIQEFLECLKQSKIQTWKERIGIGILIHKDCGSLFAGLQIDISFLFLLVKMA